MNSNQQTSAAKPAKENEEMVSAQVDDDLTEKSQNLEEKQLNPHRKQQSSAASALPSDAEPDIKHLSIEENVDMESYKQLKNDHDSLKKKYKNLAISNLVLMHENEELKMELEDYRSQDSKDGKNNVTAEQENPINQNQPWQMLGFNNPFNCAVSCVLSVVSFIFFKMGLRICNRKLIVGVHCELSKVKEAEEVCEVGNCSLTLKNFYDVSLIEENPVFSKEIKDGDNIFYAFKEVTETMASAGQLHGYPVLLVMHYKVENYAGHCVAIMPDGVFIDVQKKSYWEPGKDTRIAFVNRIDVWKVDEREAKEWQKMCHLKKCRGEGGQCIPNNGECSIDLNEVSHTQENIGEHVDI